MWAFRPHPNKSAVTGKPETRSADGAEPCGSLGALVRRLRWLASLPSEQSAGRLDVGRVAASRKELRGLQGGDLFGDRSGSIPDKQLMLLKRLENQRKGDTELY